MRISKLQKYILEKVWNDNKIKVSRNNFNNFYNKIKKAPNKKLQIKIITKSIERLIANGLLIGFGEKTNINYLYTKLK